MPGRILIIDSEEDRLLELRISLEAEGYTVALARDGMEGLEVGRQFHPDLIITEVLLNRLSGFELSSRIAAGAGFSAPVIFYTGFYRDERARQQVITKYKATDYYVKPHQLGPLKKKITEILERGASVEKTLQIPAMAEEGFTEVQEPAVEISSAETISTEPHPPKTQDSTPACGAASHISERSRDLHSTVQPRTPPANELPVSSPVLKNASKPSVLRFKWVGIAALAVFLLAGLMLWRRYNPFFQKHEETKVLSVRPRTLTEGETQPSPVMPQPDLPSVSETGQQQARSRNSLTEASKPTTDKEDQAESLSDQSSQKTDSKLLAGALRERTSRSDSESPAGLTIRDVSGAGKSPFLRHSRQPVISPQLLQASRANTLVVRIVVNREGKVLEAVPLNVDESSAALSEAILTAVHNWSFTTLHKSQGGTATKYFSFKLGNQRD